MNTTAQQSTASPSELSQSQRESALGAEPFPPAAATSQNDGLLAVELQALKDEKLAVIRRALENGDYDSDAILEKALDRMLERLEASDSEQ